MVGKTFKASSSEKSGENFTDALPEVADVIASMQQFGWIDYTMFTLMLLIGFIIGIYCGIFNGKQNTEQYLLGDRKMKTFPVSMSLIASFISGISLLGIPTEIYLYGIQFGYSIFGILLMGLIFSFIFLPVFNDLRLTSMYEYHERRFNKKVRLLGSFLFSLKIITWLPIVMYVPALAFNQGINVHVITPIVCLICIFYTSTGGIKAVVWTDVVQALVMYLSIILVALKGTISLGGFSKVWSTNWQSGRIEPPSFDLDPFLRYTFWSLVFGSSFYHLESAALSQDITQRYLSLPSIQHRRKALCVYIFGMIVFVFITGYCGLLIFATFHQCDPLTTTLAREKDQLLPLLVMNVFADWPGFTGIFMAGVLSASISSLSSGLNSMAAVILEDFYKLAFSKSLSEKQSGILMKLSVVFLGGVCVALVYVFENLGTVLQLNISISTMVSGPIVGLFIMGILLPWVNSKGALIGGISSIVLMIWLVLKAQFAISSGDLLFLEKPVSTKGCQYRFTPKVYFNSNFSTGAVQGNSLLLYRISYLWYSALGAAISIIIGLIVSFLTKANDLCDIEPMLLAPFMRKLIKQREFTNESTLIRACDINQRNTHSGKNYKLITTN